MRLLGDKQKTKSYFIKAKAIKKELNNESTLIQEPKYCLLLN